MAENPLLSLVTALAPAVAYKESNLEANKKVWNLYAKVIDRGRRDCACAQVVLAAFMVLLASVTPWPSLCRTGSPTANGCAKWQTTWATSGRCGLPCDFSCCCDDTMPNDALLSRAPWRAVLKRVRNRTPTSR